MHEFICTLCGDKHQGLGNSAVPLDTGKCCNKCNILIVIPSKLMDFNTLQEQIDFMNNMEEELSGDIIGHKDKVWEYSLDYEFGPDTGKDSYYYLEKYAEIDDIDDNVNTFDSINMHNMLSKALKKAIEDESYEAAEIINKRIKAIKVDW